MKKFLITTLAVATLSTAAFADAGPRMHRRAERRQQIAAELNLTDAQKQQIRDVRKAAFEANKPLVEALRSKRFELRQLREANDARAESVRAEVVAMREQLRAARIATREKVRSLLTAEQRAKLDSLRRR